MKEDLISIRTDMETYWVTLTSILMLFMQAGFALLEMGSVRSKNSTHILIKNVIDSALATVCWFALGFGIAYGHSIAGVIGTSEFVGYSSNPNYQRNWLFQWAFAGTSATIVSGCLAERCRMKTYIIISCCMTAFVYPTIVHWCWSEEGWLKNIGYNDYSGSGVVHLLGGLYGLVGAIHLGPRIDRFKDVNNNEKDNSQLPKNKNNENINSHKSNTNIIHKNNEHDEFKPHNVGFVALGSLILWFGWYGFNGGSAVFLTHDIIETSNLISRISINTTLAASFSGLTVFLIVIFTENIMSVPFLANGIIAGLVGICASCNTCNTFLSILSGIMSGIIYSLSSKIIKKLKIDDPLDAFSVHASPGGWGLIQNGFVHMLMKNEGWRVVKANALGMVMIITWTVVVANLLFGLLNQCRVLRVDKEVELKGMDASCHGGSGQHLDRKTISKDSLSLNVISSKNNFNLGNPFVKYQHLPRDRTILNK